MTRKFFYPGAPVVAALHLPVFVPSRHCPVRRREDYALTRTGDLDEAGVPWMGFRNKAGAPGPAGPDAIAGMGTAGTT